jgi:hypothetical protein
VAAVANALLTDRDTSRAPSQEERDAPAVLGGQGGRRAAARRRSPVTARMAVPAPPSPAARDLTGARL